VPVSPPVIALGLWLHPSIASRFIESLNLFQAPPLDDGVTPQQYNDGMLGQMQTRFTGFQSEIFFADTYDSIGPLGAKSIAENTNNPVPPAIANALRMATGVRFTSLPFTEDRIFARLQEHEALAL
jgi:hypothetical protein